MEDTLTDLSRLQFALTAMTHFLFVPLTLGLSLMIAVMETVYAVTGRRVWRDMVRFWGVFFGTNFALSIVTGIVMEFQFGMNWSFYSDYVGAVLGAPLAIAGLVAFLLEAFLVALFFLGWDRLSRRAHCGVTWLMALGGNMSVLCILTANGWMQNPVGARFGAQSQRVEVTDLMAMLSNPASLGNFFDRVLAGYVCAASFVLAVSAWYLLRGRAKRIAIPSFALASGFGSLAALALLAGATPTEPALTAAEKSQIAAGIAEHRTLPASLPWVNTLLGKDHGIAGDVDTERLVAVAEARIRSGLIALSAQARVAASPTDVAARSIFETHQGDLGFGLLVLRYTEDAANADARVIAQAAWDAIPETGAFGAADWIVRASLAGTAIVFVLSLLHASRAKGPSTAIHRIALVALPLPWVATELGWLTAEFGHQPWIVEGVLPTFVATQSIGVANLLLNIVTFAALYGAIAAIGFWLIVRAVRIGPDILIERQSAFLPEFDVLHGDASSLEAKRPYIQDDRSKFRHDTWT